MDKARMKAIARMMQGESRPADEAKRLGKNERTVERWLAAAKKAAGQNAVSVDASPPAPVPVSGAGKPAPKPNESLNAALAAAGETPPAGPAAVPGAADILDARVDQIEYCVSQLRQLKLAVGGTLITMKYSEQLQLSEPDVQKLLDLGPGASAAVRANAAELYPVLLKLFSGRVMLYGALALDGVFTLVGIAALAKKRGWKKPEEPAEKPSVEKYAKDLAPKPEKIVPNSVPSPIHVTPPPVTAETKGAATIVNAPKPEYGG